MIYYLFLDEFISKSKIYTFIFVLFSIFAFSQKIERQIFWLIYKLDYPNKKFDRNLEIGFVNNMKVGDSLLVFITKDDSIKTQKKITQAQFDDLIRDFKRLKPNKIYSNTPAFIYCYDSSLQLNIDTFSSYKYRIPCLTNYVKGHRKVILLVKKMYALVGEDYNKWYRKNKN